MSEKTLGPVWSWDCPECGTHVTSAQISPAPHAVDQLVASADSWRKGYADLEREKNAKIARLTGALKEIAEGDLTNISPRALAHAALEAERLPSCDICKRRPIAVSVPVFANVGTVRRKRISTERWCSPCHQAVLAKYPGKTMWPRRGIWLEPKEIPA